MQQDMCESIIVGARPSAAESTKVKHSSMKSVFFSLMTSSFVKFDESVQARKSIYI